MTAAPISAHRPVSAAGAATRPLALLAPLAFLPLFVGLPSMSVPFVHLLGMPTVRDGLNVSASIVICLIGVWLWAHGRIERRLSNHISLCVGWLTLSVSVGLFFEPGVANVLFWAQTLLPIFAVGFGSTLVRRRSDLLPLIDTASGATAFAVVALVVLSVANFGVVRLTTDRISVMKEIAFAIPQFKSYYPMTVLATFSLALARYLFSNGGRSVTLLLVGHALFLPLCWSRAGMLGFVLCAAIQLGYALVLGSATSKRRAVTVTLLFALVLPLAVSKLGSTFAARTDVHDVDNRSDRKRVELFIEGCGRIAASPLLGDMFIPTWEERAGGEDIAVKRLFGAHNQYVDWGLRGGLPYLALAVLFSWGAVRRASRLASAAGRRLGQEYAVVGVGGVSFLLAALAGSNAQLYYIQMQTAVPIYLVLGLVYRTHQLAAHEHDAHGSSLAGVEA